jgi:hypothetical protein
LVLVMIPVVGACVHDSMVAPESKMELTDTSLRLRTKMVTWKTSLSPRVSVTDMSRVSENLGEVSSSSFIEICMSEVRR